MLCHDAKHGRKRAPRQLTDATWESADEALPCHRLFDFSLYLSFQLHRQTAPCLLCSAGLVLILARENVLAGKRWQGRRRGNARDGCRGGKIPASNDAGGKKVNIVHNQAEQNVHVFDIKLTETASTSETLYQNGWTNQITVSFLTPVLTMSLPLKLAFNFSVNKVSMKRWKKRNNAYH